MNTKLNARRLVLAVSLAAVVTAFLTSAASHTSAAAGGRSFHGVAAAPLSPGAQCIPCSPNKPCVNPLTVCTYNGNSHHGCCLGYAPQN